MKLQLILKSSRAYYVLSDAAVILQKYGRALRYIKLALQCHGEFLRDLSPVPLPGETCHHIRHCSAWFSLWCAVTSLTSSCLTELELRTELQLSVQGRSLK